MDMDYEASIAAFLNDIHEHYGYDFRGYAPSSLKRRIDAILASGKINSIADLRQYVTKDPAMFERVLGALTIQVTDMFRDAAFYRALRETVVPILVTYPHIKIWLAGCATGQEVYSTAIILAEAGLLERSILYATDISQTAIDFAREGIYPLRDVPRYAENYQKSGGQQDFSRYYVSAYGSIIMDASLKSNIVFASHNLVTDGVFGEMNMILCRNVLIYFGRDLQARTLTLFAESLCPLGLLCLGMRESIGMTKSSHFYDILLPNARIYRRNSIALKNNNNRLGANPSSRA